MPTLTRRELYDLVWSTPMTKLAESMGISDVGLSKICDRHRVPAPPRGYWAKKEAGKPVKQAIFVQIDDPRLDRIEIVSGRGNIPEPIREIIKVRRAERKAQQPQRSSPDMVSPAIEPIANPHPSIRATATELRKAQPSAGGVVTAIGPGLCGISIGVKSIDRIVFILDQLARVCESRGLSLMPEEKRLAATTTTDRVSFEITEKTKQVPHVLTEAEIAAEERRRKQNERMARGRSAWDVDYSFSSLPPEFDVVRTGKLGLRIFGYGEGLRYSWNDGKTQTLETLVDEIVDGFEIHLAKIKLHREQRERAEAVHKELDRRRGLAKARREREAERRRILSRLIRTERQADQLRDWLSKHEHRFIAVPDTDLGRMITWTRDQLATLEDSLDPIKLADDVRARKLFAEIDDLHDPLGDPPPERRWW